MNLRNLRQIPGGASVPKMLMEWPCQIQSTSCLPLCFFSALVCPISLICPFVANSDQDEGRSDRLQLKTCRRHARSISLCRTYYVVRVHSVCSQRVVPFLSASSL